MLVGIDTQTLIWGVKRKATANRQHMISRAAEFFAARHRERDRIIVPAQALAEFLVDYEDEMRTEVLKVIAKGFTIWPFDAKAAVIAAELQRDWNALREIGHSHGLTKQQIKADINIIATAVSAGATRLYSEDAQMKSFAQDRISIYSLPELPQPRIERRGDTLF